MGGFQLECIDCAAYLKYDDHYEAYYCVRCDQWLDQHCEYENTENCDHYKERPEKPSMLENNPVKSFPEKEG